MPGSKRTSGSSSPAKPYTRVDALRSTRAVRIELDGVALAESRSPVMVFETGLPTRYYVNRSEVNFEHLVESDTVTSCPYKGRTSGYWSIRVGKALYPDRAWAYDFPTPALAPIAGLIAFSTSRSTSRSTECASSDRRRTSSSPTCPQRCSGFG